MGMGKKRKGVITANGYRVPFGKDENVLKLDSFVTLY